MGLILLAESVKTSMGDSNKRLKGTNKVALYKISGAKGLVMDQPPPIKM